MAGSSAKTTAKNDAEVAPPTLVATFSVGKIYIRGGTKDAVLSCYKEISSTLRAERARYERMHRETTRLYVQEACVQACAAIEVLGEAIGLVDSAAKLTAPLMHKGKQLCACPWDLSGYIGSYIAAHARTTSDVANAPARDAAKRGMVGRTDELDDAPALDFDEGEDEGEDEGDGFGAVGEDAETDEE